MSIDTIRSARRSYERFDEMNVKEFSDHLMAKPTDWTARKYLQESTVDFYDAVHLNIQLRDPQFFND